MSKPPMNLPALFAQMGDWKYYSTIMRLEDVADRVKFADQINEVRPGRQLSDLIQRALSEGRASEIGGYLTSNEDRFFNSLVVAVYGGDPEWLEFEIGANQVNPLAGGVPQWAANAFGFLHLSGGETLFAIDGQHRLAGISSALARDASLADERISVVVVAHKTSDEGRRRTRKLFTTLNRSAVPVNKSEIIALDESDASAIITRRLVEEHPFFSSGQVLAKYGAANLPASDGEHFVTIIKLYDLVSYVLGYIVNSLDRERRTRLRYVRPSDAMLETYYTRTAQFFETFANAMPELKEYFLAEGDAAKAIVQRERHTRDNVLFRAVGVEIFVRLIYQIKEEDEVTWRQAIKKVAALPRRFTDVPYRDVIYDTSGERLILGRTRLTISLLSYMLGYEPADKDDLRRKYAEALEQEVSGTRLPRRMKTS